MLKTEISQKLLLGGTTMIVLVILINKLEWKIRNHDSTTFESSIYSVTVHSI